MAPDQATGIIPWAHPTRMLNELPADCLRHHRTVRRDLEALEAARFPLGPKFRVKIFLAHGNGLRSLGRETLLPISGNSAIDNGRN